MTVAPWAAHFGLTAGDLDGLRGALVAAPSDGATDAG